MNYDLVSRYEEMYFNTEMELVIRDLLEKVMSEVNCFLILLDDYYRQIMGNIFDRPLDANPYFKVILLITSHQARLCLKLELLQILVNESEDLLSPNYDTVRVIHEVKKNSCNLYVIFLANGEQIARFLEFGDRYVILFSFSFYCRKISSTNCKVVNCIENIVL